MTGKLLFREDVLQARRGEAIGSTVIATPLSGWMVSGLAGLLSALLLAFLFVGSYTRRESVSGQLVPSAGLLNVIAPGVGTVVHARVHSGQAVKRGDILFEISTDQSSASMGQTHLAMSSQMEAQRARLQDVLANSALLTEQQASSLRSKTVLLQSQLKQIEDQISIEKQQVKTNEHVLEKIRPLGLKGYVSIVQIQQQQSAVFDAVSQYKSLVRQELDIKQQLDDARQQLAQLPLDSANKQNEVQGQLADITQSLAQNELQRAIVLRAPSDGTVTTVLAKTGQATSAGQTLASLLPTGSVLEAELLVPTRGVGFIVPGNRVVLRYQAFPYQKFGLHYGRITEISRSALPPAEVSEFTGERPTEPLYRVVVSLDSQEIEAYGRAEAVKPGMAVDADILMERRRLIEWVFEPLFGIKSRLGEGGNG